MEQSKIERINVLSQKSKAEGLTDIEKIEQKALREEYLACIRRSLKVQLDNTYIVDEFGNREHLSRRDK